MFKRLVHKAGKLFTRGNYSIIDQKKIQKIIGYYFKNINLLVMAFKHRSYLAVSKDKSWQSNERLEFLGDAVLNIIVTEFFYKKLPKKSEGELTKIKSILVSRQVLAEIIRKLGLGQFLLINRGEEITGGRNRLSNLANLYESIVGAIYLDRGLKNAERFVENTLITDYKKILNQREYINYKSILLEYAQSKGRGNPSYRIVEENGPDHKKIFVIDVSVDDEYSAEGRGNSKKIAEQEAAQNLLQKIAPELVEND
jgi:ribonuclease-3